MVSHRIEILGAYLLLIAIGIYLISSSAFAASRGILVKTQASSGTSRQIKLYSGYHALVVGCGDYRAGWPKLPNPVEDAREVALTLKKMNWQVELLEDPVWDRLDAALNRLITGPGRAKDKAVLFWFSGHGHTLEEADGTKLGYIVPIDAPRPVKDETGFMRRAIDMRQIETVAKRIRAKHVLMVFDSCFSGALFSMVSVFLPKLWLHLHTCALAILQIHQHDITGFERYGFLHIISISENCSKEGYDGRTTGSYS